MTKRPARASSLLLVTAIIALDQVAKALVDRFLAVHDSRPLLDGIVRLTYVQNRGAAFGIFSEADLPYQALLFTIVSVLALAAIAVYAWRMPAESRLPQTALACIMGGAIGNLLDRARLGYVIDYIDVYWGRHHWPAFNVADSAITVGVTLLVLDILREPRGEESVAAVASPAGPAD